MVKELLAHKTIDSALKEAKEALERSSGSSSVRIIKRGHSEEDTRYFVEGSLFRYA